MPILPLPVFEDDLKALEAERAAYAALKIPKTMVVRFGFMKLVGEFPYQGAEKPGCGSKIVIRSHRGTEIGEMLTSTCPNSGCSKSVSRKEMLEYIQNSGGRDYPFFEHGRALRVATPEDMQAQARIEQSKHALRLKAKGVAARVNFAAKIVEVEPILGGEQTSVYYHSEERIDLREIVPALQKELGVRVEMRQVGARDEARLTADYERCGQYCCCKNFLKVLKPVSMKSAKIQKATLDPLKISGRCGRLMCCLRYEDQTYDELRKKLPKNKSRVGTPEGDGTVLESQILTQLVLVRLDAGDKDIAVPVEDLSPPVSPVAPPPRPERSAQDAPPREGRSPRRPEPPRGVVRPRPAPAPDIDASQTARQPVEGAEQGHAPAADDAQDGPAGPTEPGTDSSGRRKRRRRRGRRPDDTTSGPPTAPQAASDRAPSADVPGPRADEFDLDDIETDFGDAPRAPSGSLPAQDGPTGRKRRRRRRRSSRDGGPGGAPHGPEGQGGSGGGGTGSPPASA